MPTPDPSLNGNRPGSRGLRGARGGADRRTGAAGLRSGLAAAFVCTAVIAQGCSPQPRQIDVEAREAALQSRLAYASEVAAATLPEGSAEVNRLGYVPEGVEISRGAPPLSNTFSSVEELAAAVLEGIEDDRGEALWSLALTKEEFHGVVWPVLPASRPERNTPFEYTWGTLENRSSNALSATLSRYRGRRFELVGVEFVAHEQRQREFGAFRVHRDARVVVRAEDGSEQRLDLFGSVIERGGKFKVFSYVTD